MNQDELELYKHLRKSANYHFCNDYLPALFYTKPLLFMECILGRKNFSDVLTVIFEIMKKDGYDVSSLEALSFIHMVDKEKKASGTIIQLIDPKYETECNYVCLFFDYITPKYYESELYEEGFFGLCGRDEKGGHINYGHRGGDIKTIDDMWKAAVGLNRAKAAWVSHFYRYKIITSIKRAARDKPNDLPATYSIWAKC